MLWQNRTVYTLLIYIFEFQNCAVYQKTAVSLDDAIASKR
jgi:hypothetical protein